MLVDLSIIKPVLARRSLICYYFDTQLKIKKKTNWTGIFIYFMFICHNNVTSQLCLKSNRLSVHRPLQVKCVNSERGCQWTGTVDTLEDHIASCQFVVVPVPTSVRRIKVLESCPTPGIICSRQNVQRKLMNAPTVERREHSLASQKTMTKSVRIRY